MEKSIKPFNPKPIKDGLGYPNTNCLNAKEFDDMVTWMGNKPRPMLDYLFYLLAEGKTITAQKIMDANPNLNLIYPI